MHSVFRILHPSINIDNPISRLSSVRFNIVMLILTSWRRRGQDVLCHVIVEENNSAKTELELLLRCRPDKKKGRDDFATKTLFTSRRGSFGSNY